MISIIIPTIGSVSKEFFVQAFDSAIATGKACREILILDNSQNTAWSAWMESLSGRDGRIRILKVPQRLDMAGSWNLGLAEAKAGWTLLLHDDDYLLPGALEGIEKEIGREDAGMIAYDFLLLENGGLAPRNRGQGLQGIFDEVPKFVSTLINRRIALSLGGFDPKAGNFLDLLLFIKLNGVAPMVQVTRALGVYRYHGQNASAFAKRAKGYGDYLPYVLGQAFDSIPDTHMRQQALLHMISFTYPCDRFLARLARFTLRKLGFRGWIMGNHADQA